MFTLCFNTFFGPGFIKQDLQEKLFQKLASPRLPKAFVVIKHLAEQKSCETNNYMR